MMEKRKVVEFVEDSVEEVVVDVVEEVVEEETWNFFYNWNLKTNVNNVLVVPKFQNSWAQEA